MLTVPVEQMQMIVRFAPLFSKRVWEHAQVLVVGAILAPGKRTVSAALRVRGVSEEEHLQNYPRVLNRAVWSTLAAGRMLLGLLLQALAPTGVVVLGLDDTIERRRGEKSKARGSIAIRCALRAPIWSKPAACGGCAVRCGQRLRGPGTSGPCPF